ncbi:MFS transporter [Kribbella sp. NBC_00382]|uniref:MFS transporter n=1 Tax=Kribbella sp. NBC_00382 TaxID=2975967 RepID=UPI002E1ADBA3
MTQVEEKSQAAGYRWRWAALAVLLVAEAMNLLDATIVQVAAPLIHTELGGRESDIQWFSAAYTLPFAGLLITGGRLGDIVGRKRLFRIGMIGFLLGSLTCALAPGVGVLIAARAVQGAAAALVIPQTIGLIRAMFDQAELPKALGSIGPVMGLAGISGPLLGGLLTHADLFGSSWRAVFAVNLPLGLAVLLATPLLLEDRSPLRLRPDLAGSALLVIATVLIVYPLIQSRLWILLPVGLLVAAAWLLQQRRRNHTGRTPLIEFSLFENRGFAAALLTSTLFFAVLTGATLVIVLYLQVGLHQGVLHASLILLPWSTASGLASWLAGSRLIPRYGTTRIMFTGLAIFATGLLLIIAGLQLSVALGIAGLGAGLFTTPFFTAALHRVRPTETGSAAGLLNAVQQLGGTIGVALLGTIFFHHLSPAHPKAAAESAFWIALILVAAAATSAAFMRRRD